ncbi:hypothetical protein CDL15_Pgr007625 [Punica granatum]|uniref:Uncharacterized protein n=1 Tax=Punica granatum TaxID=22663 RepID=A0A218X9E9_PUNGR|nr:hypothetical protein CDL15_Pgr007625 [Punica granatum]
MSCSDFTSSSLRFFSDCEGGDSDSESYIEIEVDRGGAKVYCHNGEYGSREAKSQEEEEEEEEEDLQLRISISSTVPFPKLCSSSLQSREIPEVEFRGVNESAILSGLSSSCSDARIDGTGLRGEEGEEEEEEEERVVSGGRGRGGGGGGAKFAAVCRLVNAVVSSLKVLPETGQEHDASSTRENYLSRHQQLPRDTSKTTKTRNGARVMQFLFKFRVMQFRTFMASLVKNRPVLAKGKTLGESPREMRLEETLRFHHKMAKNSRRGVAGRIDKKTKSCPGSMKCSPINQETYENSTITHGGESAIQAAIAHCKRSFAMPMSRDFTCKSRP